MGSETYQHIPEDFLFGAATAGGQVEGHHNSDWAEFEKRNAEKLAKEAQFRDYGNGKLPEDVWARLAPELTDPSNYISKEACGWREGHYIEDLDIAQTLGLKAIRFSIERSWTQPTSSDELNQESILHYQKFIDECEKRGIEPILTFFHFTNPLWISNKGGWENKDIRDNFNRYTKSLLQSIDREFKHILTINEPEVYTFMGWIAGEWPNGEKNLLKAFRVRKNLIETHKKMYSTIKEYDDSILVSSALNLQDIESYSSKLSDRIGTTVANKASNGLFIEKILDEMDFLAINHYMHNVQKGLIPGKYIDTGEKKSDMGWNVNSESLYRVLLSLKKHKKPIIITENGVADAQDSIRPQQIKDAINSINRAIGEGIDVRGYLHWSLLDNIEWDKGEAMRFGLIEIDYKTQKRTVRESAKTYSDIIKSKK